ncbi:MAG: hypothetical protein ACOCU3_00310 [bacterium]
MKKHFAILAAVIFTASVFLPRQAGAQSPQKMSYQAVIRDASDNLVTDQTTGMQISILQGSASGTAVYVETHTPNTNPNGLVSIEIGTGTVVSGDFTTIDWANGPYFIQTETDPEGGTDYTITGTSQLLSVPYALHSGTSDVLTGEITESQISDLQPYLISEDDPLFTSWDKSSGIEIAENQITDLQEYLTEESDPVYGASAASGIEAGNIENWDNAYSDRLKWDGGSTGLDATAGRSALGLGSLAMLDQVPDESVEEQHLAENSVNRDAAAPDITNYLVPVGTIVMWSGAIEEIPEGWRLCDGTEGTPDLRGRFIVGYDSEDGDYDVIGAGGGASSHTLTMLQMPAHNHEATTGAAGEHSHSLTLTTSSSGSHNHSASTSLSGMTKPMRYASSSYRSSSYTDGAHSSTGLGNNTAYTYNPSASTTISIAGSHTHGITGNTDNTEDHTHTVTVDNTGGGEAFDKRPPYLVLAYIIKIEN